MEASNRKLLRENKPRHHHVRAVMKTAFAHVVRGPASTSASKDLDGKDVSAWFDERSGGLRPGRNIEDAEREAIDHLFSIPRHHDCHHQSAHWSPLSSIRKYLMGNQSEEATADDALRATTSSASDRFAPKASEMKGYSPDTFDDPNAPRQATAEEASKSYTDLTKYKPVKWNEPDGLPQPSPEEKSKNYKDVDKYASPDTSKHVAAFESTGPSYNDLRKYRPVEWNEPDGLPEKTPEELSKNYDDLAQYGPVTWNEPDGLRTPTSEELSKNYDDLGEYGAVTWNEPDGLPKLTPEELSKQYGDLSKYSKHFVASDALLEAHEAAQQDGTPRAEPIAAKEEEASAADPADPAKDYDDLDKYGPVKWNEPDGLQKPTPEELSKKYQDLHLYSQYANSDPATPRIHPEEASKQYNDLRKYDAFPNAGPAEERLHPELASKRYTDLDEYPSAGYEEPDKTKHVHPEELTKDYKDLSRYQPHSFDSPEKKYPMHPEEATKAYDDLGSYKPVMHNEPDGKPVEKADPVASSLASFEKSFGHHTEPQTAAEIRSDVLWRASRNSEDTMVQHQGSEGADSVSSRRVLTGYYARDFPEEFATSWNTSNSGSKSTGSEKDEADFSSMDESFPSEKAGEMSKLQPALDRSCGQGPLLSAVNRMERMRLQEEDAYSKSFRGREHSYTDDCAGKSTRPTFARHHKGRQEEETAEEQPVSYKMLAYDHSTQSVSVAETCSRVRDTSTPATPAEALLRVSNPSKFFPYFSALQAEGYEIASGGGDVLVFRKVRPGTATAKDASSGSATINPVDMMGRSGASRSVSATGCVNDGSPQHGPSDAGQSQERKMGKTKRSLGRKVVIGTAWVAGTAYAVSVAGEYLSTGGNLL
ncbi:hypothetical protein E4U41_007648 [Claviceps citrina]|nr:hypothetical protein E4U41_007648 [Claviceps citrina]